MGVTGITFYMSALFLFMTAMLSAMTVMPGRGNGIGVAMAITFAASAICLALAMSMSRLPPDHWVRHSRPLHLAMGISAGVLTLFSLVVIPIM